MSALIPALIKLLMSRRGGGGGAAAGGGRAPADPQDKHLKYWNARLMSALDDKMPRIPSGGSADDDKPLAMPYENLGLPKRGGR